jgi:AcrR family transcriptional regulator
MSTIEQLPTTETERRRPMRADARRNYEKVLAAARDAFAAGGSATSLEEIARQAGVGIGTLYRHFPNRQALLAAVYAEEVESLFQVESLCRSAEDFAELEPWDALVAWLRGFVGYMATKQALAAELLDYLERDSPLFTGCRCAMYTAGEPLLKRARESGVVRADADLPDVIQMVAGIAKIQTGDPGQIERILDIALDGLRASS